MIRMLLIGYIYGIRSERRLVEEVHLNLAAPPLAFRLAVQGIRGKSGVRVMLDLDSYSPDEASFCFDFGAIRL
jgi:transposase